MLSLILALSLAPAVPDSLRVPILVYHNVQPAAAGAGIRKAELTMRPEIFAAQMQYLKDSGIHVVSLAALVDALEGKRGLPQPAVVITFDDGRVNQYEHAYPILRKLGYTATFFPFTHAIGRNPRYFTWAQLKEMQSAGMTIGSHTHLHVKVTQLRSAKAWQQEIAGSREVLRAHLGSDVAFFAFPWGAVSAAGDSAVRAAGYKAARAFTGGGWNSGDQLIRLRAVPVTEDMALFRHAVDVPKPRAVVAPAGHAGR